MADRSRGARGNDVAAPEPREIFAVGKIRRVLCQDQLLAGPQYQLSAVICGGGSAGSVMVAVPPRVADNEASTTNAARARRPSKFERIILFPLNATCTERSNPQSADAPPRRPPNHPT